MNRPLTLTAAQLTVLNDLKAVMALVGLNTAHVVGYLHAQDSLADYTSEEPQFDEELTFAEWFEAQVQLRLEESEDAVWADMENERDVLVALGHLTDAPEADDGH